MVFFGVMLLSSGVGGGLLKLSIGSCKFMSKVKIGDGGFMNWNLLGILMNGSIKKN